MDPPKLQGWHADPFGLHERRYFSAGRPTKLVQDGNVECYDEPPAEEYPDPTATSILPTGGAAPGRVASAGAGSARAYGGQPRAVPDVPAAVRRTRPSVSARGRRPRSVEYGIVVLVTVAVVVAVVAIFGGRSQNGGSKSTAGSGLSGQSLVVFVTQSARKTLAQQTADITVQGQTDADGNDANLQGTGQADFATNTMAMNVTTSFSSQRLLENEIVTSQDLYLQVTVDGHSMAQFFGGRHWFEIPMAASATQNTAQDAPDWSLQLLEQQGARVTAMGTQDIGGLNCNEYVVTPTRQAVIAAARQEWARLGLSSSETAAAQQVLANSTPPTVTVWFDPGRQLACQVDVYLQLSLGNGAGSGSAPATETTQLLMTFSHYGVPVTITPPAKSDTISF